jgi:hypothetical protein
VRVIQQNRGEGLAEDGRSVFMRNERDSVKSVPQEIVGRLTWVDTPLLVKDALFPFLPLD